MPPEEFRQWVRRVADRAADYLEDVGELPVQSRNHPGALMDSLPAAAPEHGESFDAILRDVDDLILPALTHWNHPSFHGYFAVTGSGPGVLGELLAAAFNVNAMVWKSSPGATELELRVLEWLRDLLGLPAPFLGVMQDAASTSSLVALAAARQRSWPEVRRHGMFGLGPGRIYTSEEAHSSIEKAALTLGFGSEGVRTVATDDRFRLQAGALDRAVREDRDRGIRPVAVVATLGTTSTTSMDPVADIARVAAEHDLWLHVDAAYAGPVAMLPEYRDLFLGWEHADSIVVNPHKWLFTPVDCSALFTREPDRIREAFSLVPEYLQTPDREANLDLMDYGVALGRRFRALKLWFVLRYFGAEGLRERIRGHIAMAQRVADWIRADSGWELAAPCPLATVVFRRLGVPARANEALDTLNMELMRVVNESGELFLSHTRVRGRVALRLSVGNLRTDPPSLERSWRVLSTIGDQLDIGAR